MPSLNVQAFNINAILNDSLVQSVIDYGACIWGHYDFRCIEPVQNTAMRLFLCVPCKTPDTAVEGEVGRLTCPVRQRTRVAGQWCHYSRMGYLNKHIFSWAVNRVLIGHQDVNRCSESLNWTTLLIWK